MKSANDSNKHFINTRPTKSLDTSQWRPQQSSLAQSPNVCITKQLHHPSIKKVGAKDTFSFWHIFPQESYKAIPEVNKNRSTSCKIPAKVFTNISRRNMRSPNRLLYKTYFKRKSSK